MPPKKSGKRKIDQYQHPDKERANNPPVGLVTPDTDRDAGKKTYAYDPHLDPSLQWAGKAEHTSFEVPTILLHVHERIDPRTILEAVGKRNGESPSALRSLFEDISENLPLRKALDFYEHPHGWSNRLIAGDSLLVMNSLLEKEGMAGIRGKTKQRIEFVRVEPLGGTRWLHADAETRGDKPERVVLSFGPEHAPLEQRQVELAWEEARTLHPKPAILVFAAFQFDPEAAKDIDATRTRA
jgi:hypothetical protein